MRSPLSSMYPSVLFPLPLLLLCFVVTPLMPTMITSVLGGDVTELGESKIYIVGKCHHGAADKQTTTKTVIYVEKLIENKDYDGNAHTHDVVKAMLLDEVRAKYAHLLPPGGAEGVEIEFLPASHAHDATHQLFAHKCTLSGMFVKSVDIATGDVELIPFPGKTISHYPVEKNSTWGAEVFDHTVVFEGDFKLIPKPTSGNGAPSGGD